MSQNTSSAVMQQRTEAHDSLDYYPTPAWATRALCEYLIENKGQALALLSCREPACGEGHMAKVLQEYFCSVESSDVHDYGFGSVQDYLFPFSIRKVDWTISNPPFCLAEEFIYRALQTSIVGVAMLVRSAFAESIGRYELLFSKNRPSVIAQFVERVPMVKGRVDENASSATAYCWMIWKTEKANLTEFVWIAPCRDKLERKEDYADMASARITNDLPLFTARPCAGAV